MRASLAVLMALASGCGQNAPGGDGDGGGDRPDAGPPDAMIVTDTPPEIDGQIVINEFMAANALTHADEDDQPGDWVELYNPTDTDIPLHGYAITDDLTGTKKSLIPDGPVLQAGGRLLFWLDGEPERGPYHASLSLAREGGDLGLMRPDGSFIEQLHYGAQETDFSAAREPDGSGTWVIEWHPSPGTANPAGAGAAPGADPEQVPAAGDLSQQILAYDLILNLELIVSEASRAALLATPEVYAPASLKFRGRTYGPVGLRLKGMDTFQPFDAKPSFRINVDEFVPGAKFFGLDDLTLNNMASDASMMRERLSYLVARTAGVPASRANHAVIRVNGALYGLYINVETVRNRMVARWFADASGPLFEGEGADFIANQVANFEHESGPDDRTLLAGTAAALTNPDPVAAIAAAASHVHMGQFHRFWGMCAVVGQFDSIPVYTDDYFLYADPTTDRLWFMPWGMDETFLSSNYSPLDVNEILAVACTDVPACVQSVADQAWAILAMTEADDLLDEQARVQTQIAPHVAMDTRKPYTAEQVATAQDGVRYFISNRRQRLELVLPPPSP